MHDLAADFKEHDLRLRRSIESVAHKSRDYRVQGFAGRFRENEVHTRAEISNDLEKLNPTFRPSKISIWSREKKVNGMQFEYSNGQKKSHGGCDGSPSHSLALEHNGSEVIIEIQVQEAIESNSVSYITAIKFATSQCRVLDTAITGEQQETQTTNNSQASSNEAGTKTASSNPTSKDAPTSSGQSDSSTHSAQTTNAHSSSNTNQAKDTNTGSTTSPKPPPTIKTTTWTKPEDPRYSLRGFLSFIHNGNIITVGAIWGKDGFVPVPPARLQPTLCKDFLGLSKDLQKNIEGHLSAFAGKFFMGASLSTTSDGDHDPVIGGGGVFAAEPATKHFNALDGIDVNWRIITIGFACDGQGSLSGLRVLYHNGTELHHGSWSKETEKWPVEVRSELAVVKMTAGKLEARGRAYVDTVEFVRGAGKEQGVPVWPLEVLTLRFLGGGETRVSVDVRQMVEPAPKIGNAVWDVRGFFGEERDGLISRLGVIWGKE